jgi:hypothetical protein
LNVDRKGCHIMTERRPLTNAVNQAVPGVDSEIVRSFVTQRPSHSNESQAGQRSTTRSPVKFQRVGLIPVTVRLRPEIAFALKRASLERELEGESIYTQQELVEQVLCPWLQSQGYLP